MDSRKNSGIQPAKLQASPMAPAAAQGESPQKFTKTKEYLRTQFFFLRKEKRKQHSTRQN